MMDCRDRNNGLSDRLVRVRWRGEVSHASLVSETVSQHIDGDHGHDLVLLVQGHSIPVHRAVLAASSPYLSQLVEDSLDTISLVDISLHQARQAVRFMYHGVLDRMSEVEIDELLEAVKHLNIIGMRSMDKTAIIKIELEDGGETDIMEDDDVFSDQAVDLSPVNRHPPTPLLSGSLDLASRRMASLSKISQALNRNSNSTSGSSKSSNNSGSGSDTRQFTRAGTSFDNHPGSQDRFLNRIKKPKPLTNLPKHDGDYVYLKPKTPRTPLLVSPDCHALEERFRNLIENNAADTEKLRNLSVSSADFNFEAGGSLPNTPLRTPRSFHFPPSTCISAGTGNSNVSAAAATSSSSGTLDLSIKKIGSETDSDSDGGGKIPTINVIKPEPEDSADDPAQSRDSFHFSLVTKSSPSYHGESPTSGSQCADSPPTPVSQSQLSPSAVKSEPDPRAPTIFFPQFPLPLSYSAHNLSPSHYLTPSSPGVGVSDPQNYRLLLPAAFSNSDKNFQVKVKTENPVSTCLKKKEKDQSGSKQSFKCQKCGKCYNWNYNLNRHMRFECGIENRFECSMCQKRFPYKQNVAIHLKRKHKLQIDNADDMIAQGHITLLPGSNNEEKS